MMQARKARAEPCDYPNGKRAWRVSHPDTSIVIVTFNPFTAARKLLEYVLANQTDLVLK